VKRPSTLPRGLPAAMLVAAGAMMLIASEFADTFAYRSGGAVVEVSRAGDRHDYAFLLLGAFAIVALAVALASGSRPAAIAVAAIGAVALLLFLVIDLPDAGATGVFPGFVQGKAHPQAGYWLELAGAIAVLIGGGALALKLRPATIPRRAEHQPISAKGA
jgi:hypothetical protein